MVLADREVVSDSKIACLRCLLYMLTTILATLSVLGDYFTMYNMNVTNDAGQDAQAIALYTGGNNQGFYSSSLLGWQDTALVNKGTQFFGRCYIEGAVDFIYGLSANAWFVSYSPSRSKQSFT